MRRIPINSRIVQSVGYDPSKSLLEIKFKITKRIYAFIDVPKEVYQNFIKSRSKGNFYNQKIKYQFQAILVKL
jgi:hypothetical protein